MNTVMETMMTISRTKGVVMVDLNVVNDFYRISIEMLWPSLKQELMSSRDFSSSAC